MPKFLILRFSSIGDIVLTTPVIRCLKQQLPLAEIHFLTKPAFAGLLAHNPYIHQLHVLDKPLLNKISELKQLNFDYIIDLHHNLRTLVIKTLLDKPSFSFDKLNFEKWLKVNTFIDNLPQHHIVDRYLDTLTPFGIHNDHRGLDYFFPPTMEPLTELPASYIAFAIGAQHSTKRMPNTKIIELCKALQLPVILLGGEEDGSNGELIAQASGTHVFNYCGKLSLHQSAAVISKAIKVITHDTGLMHIAAALKKDIVSIWGNTIPEFGMTAYRGNESMKITQHEVSGLSCRPCSKIGFNQCPKKHFDCMSKQDIDLIVRAVLD